MTRYILKRLLNALPVLLFVTLAVFLMTYLLPGDPATVILGHSASEESVARLREKMGLDRPFLERYLKWLLLVLRGDLGHSYLSKQPVTVLIGNALPVTLELTFLALIVALTIALPAGIVSGYMKDSWVDLLTSTTTFLGLATPSFWLGIMLAYLFGVRWRMLPPSGFVPLGDGLTANLRAMVLPSVTLGLFLAAPLTRYLRTGMVAALNQDYTRTATGKGLAESIVLLRHVLPNALIPFVTVLGMQFGYLLGGTMVIEQVFGLPGMGRTALQGIFDRDYAIVQGVVLVVATGFILINILVDIVYCVLDPRVRVEG